MDRIEELERRWRETGDLEDYQRLRRAKIRSGAWKDGLVHVRVAKAAPFEGRKAVYLRCTYVGVGDDEGRIICEAFPLTYIDRPRRGPLIAIYRLRALYRAALLLSLHTNQSTAGPLTARRQGASRPHDVAPRRRGSHRPPPRLVVSRTSFQTSR